MDEVAPFLSILILTALVYNVCNIMTSYINVLPSHTFPFNPATASHSWNTYYPPSSHHSNTGHCVQVGHSLAQNCMYSHDIESIDDPLNTQAGAACSPGGHMALCFPR